MTNSKTISTPSARSTTRFQRCYARHAHDHRKLVCASELNPVKLAYATWSPPRGSHAFGERQKRLLISFTKLAPDSRLLTNNARHEARSHRRVIAEKRHFGACPCVHCSIRRHLTANYGNYDVWKAWKAQIRLSTLPTRLGNPCGIHTIRRSRRLRVRDKEQDLRFRLHFHST
jgi:hypothetical protein